MSLNREDLRDLDVLLRQLDEEGKMRLSRLVRSCAKDAGREQRAMDRAALRALPDAHQGDTDTPMNCIGRAAAVKAIRHPRRGSKGGR